MASKAPCLTKERIADIVFEAENEALEGVLSRPNWKPGQQNRPNNVFRPDGEVEKFLFNKVQEVTERCYKMGQGRYGNNNPNRNVKGGRTRRQRSSKRKTRRS
jgi:hypothetical protein